MKTCAKCKTEKELHDFPKDKRKQDGLSSHCKACRYELIKNWRKNNPDKFKSIKNKYDNSIHGKAANRDRCKNYRSTDGFKLSVRKWRGANKEKYIKSQCGRNSTYLKKQVDSLGDFYIKIRLKKQGFPLTGITTDIIEIKKLMILTKREIKNHENKD